MSQLRLNPLTGRWVTVASDRAERPGAFQTRTLAVQADPSRPCPFCPGNEEETPPALETYDRDGHWLVRVVPNLYPAFTGTDKLAVHHHGPLFASAPASGIHEVFVFTPNHTQMWADLSDDQARLVMRALRDRIADHAHTPGIRYSQAIVNVGREAGASLEHPHGQLLGIPFVPGEIADEEHGFQRFQGACLLSATLEAELDARFRIVVEDERALVVVPYWAGTPYELLLIPKEHAEHLQEAATPDVEAAGIVLRDALRMLRETVGDVAYNLVFHTAPHNHDGAFHWHVHVFPKLTTQAGFEQGTGVLINIVPPEFAAADLRRALEPST